MSDVKHTALEAELLEALKGLVLCMERFRASDKNQADAYYLLAKQPQAWAKAYAAIAKASGEAP